MSMRMILIWNYSERSSEMDEVKPILCGFLQKRSPTLGMQKPTARHGATGFAAPLLFSWPLAGHTACHWSAQAASLGPTLPARCYPTIVVSVSARILVTCAAVKMTSIVKVIGGVVERMGRISKS
jgi:hypothetical protein